MIRKILALSALMLAGCVTNPDGSQQLSEGGKAALREVAVIGVARFVRENADSAKVEKLRTALLELQQLPDITTVAGLRELVQARIDTLDDPYDRQDFGRLLNILAPLLEEYVGSGQLAPDGVVAVHDFLRYLADALPPPQS
jgi:hypothetical protein